MVDKIILPHNARLCIDMSADVTSDTRAEQCQQQPPHQSWSQSQPRHLINHRGWVENGSLSNMFVGIKFR